ncbi:MAG TPA: UDP-3-O-(3-hydroxymyristoyl)glucosamine N-acyltransferase [Gammaproteobacteria bacterium]|nr:UDP-3-O-(3-hydroxymyristoyl)glucosamine N-acyltransferase [Gammaproteobacteria bacterium]
MPRLSELAQHLGGRVQGDGDCIVNKLATLENAGPGDISFLSNKRYARYLATTRASAVIVSDEHAAACTVNALIVPDPYLAYARLAVLLQPLPPGGAGCHPSAVIHPESEVHPQAFVAAHAVIEDGARLAAGVLVGPGCIVGRDSRIGQDSVLVARVTVCHGVSIGRRAVIHPGVVIGSDGFGLAKDGEGWLKIPQLGGVVIGDDVEIGANTTIDRGALDDTVIEDGVKLDNQIQVAHNVKIGAHTAIAGCTGIAGSARIGARCTIGGGVGIVGHTEIADDVHITGMSFVAHSIHQAGVYSSGTPLEPTRTWRRNYARFRHLDEMARRLRRVEFTLKQEKKTEEK